jgi:hypothetical protein
LGNAQQGARDHQLGEEPQQLPLQHASCGEPSSGRLGGT